MNCANQDLTVSRVLTIRERPWCNKRCQHALGRFYLDGSTGIYYQEGTRPEHIERLRSVFPLVSTPLVQAGLNLGLTMTTCEGLTPNGDSSTIYADFRSYTKDGISPHIVMGSESLEEDLILPHLVHELSHIFYALLPESLRQRWIELLPPDSSLNSWHEVTGYAQKNREAWLKRLNETAGWSESQNCCRVMLERYATEAFCETVAVLTSPTYLSSRCNVSLAGRRKFLEELGLFFRGGSGTADNIHWQQAA